MSSRMPLVDDRMFDALVDFYPKTCTITTPTEAQSSTGHITNTYNAVPALTDLSCRFAPSKKGKEVKESSQIYTVGSHTIVFNDFYLAITTKMRALIDGISYDILDVGHDSEDETTRLYVEYAK